MASAEPTRSAGGPRSASVATPAGRLRRARSWLRGSAPGLVLLAVLVGLGAGAGAVLFRYLVLWFTELFTGRADYSDAGRVPNPNLPWLGIYFVLLVPVLGGLIYGPIVDRFAREARGHGVPEVMYAVAERGGRIGRTVPVVKSLASALCIGSGGSVGREGPIVQIGSALGSTLGQALRVPESRLRLLVACGAAGGISATFNAPIAGVFFALELILRDFETESFGVVVLSSVSAAVVGHAAFGSQPFLLLPAFTLHARPAGAAPPGAGPGQRVARVRRPAGTAGHSPGADRNTVVDLRDYALVDIQLTDGRPPAGLRIIEVSWPPRSHLVAVRRDGQTIPTTTETVLREADRLAVLVPAGDTPDSVADRLRRRPAGTGSPRPPEGEPPDRLR